MESNLMVSECVAASRIAVDRFLFRRFRGSCAYKQDVFIRGSYGTLMVNDKTCEDETKCWARVGDFENQFGLADLLEIYLKDNQNIFLNSWP